MENFEEFDLNRMFENLPEQNPSANLEKRVQQTIDKLQKQKKPRISRKINWLSIAASILMFFLGYTLSHWLSNSNQLTEVKNDYQEIRKLLIEQMKEPSSPSQRLASIRYLRNSSEDQSILEELIYLLQQEENENVRLALIQSLASYANDEAVQEVLIEQLNEESNPLIAIPILNILSKIKAKKGWQMLKEYLEKDSLHPMIQSHLDKLKL